MKRKFKYYHIVLDGIDKVGKDLVRSYIYYLGKQKYICTARGFMSMQSYAIIFDRDYQYSLETQKYVLNVLLTADKEDWLIRCKNTNEHVIEYETHTKAFEEMYALLKDNGYKTMRFNTSEITPYQIAKQIVEYAEKLDMEED